MASTLTKVTPELRRLTETKSIEAVAAIERSCETVRSFDASNTARMKAVQSIELSCKATLSHALDALSNPTIPASEQVLIMSVVAGTRGYLEEMLLQANGSYENGWYDAASVMLRKFVETLIIEIYEHHGRAADIKNPKDGNFYMLSGLVDILVADQAFNLARESKATLPHIKALGDRSAHNRRYMATKTDVDKIVPGLRVLADDFLHLAGLKR